MARNTPKKAAAPVAAATSSPTSAAPPADAAQGATEATASSTGVSETAVTGAGDIAPTGGGQAEAGAPIGALTTTAFEQAHAEISAEIDRTGEPLVITGDAVFQGVDLASGPDRTGLVVQTPDATFYFDELESVVLRLGDDQVLTLGELLDLPWRQQADVILMLVDAASREMRLPSAQDLRSDLDLIETSAADLPDAPDGFVWVEGKSRDGQPFRRAGVVWAEKYAFHLVAITPAASLLDDPHVHVRELYPLDRLTGGVTDLRNL